MYFLTTCTCGILEYVLTLQLTTVLARALQALSDPYCHSTCVWVFLCVSVCLFVCNFDAKYLGN